MRVVSLLILMLGLSACYAHGGHHHGGATAVRIDGVGEVEFDGHSHGGRGFCPPGHARKGNC